MRITDEKVSLTDPDAAPMGAQVGGSAVLGYRDTSSIAAKPASSSQH